MDKAKIRVHGPGILKVKSKDIVASKKFKKMKMNIKNLIDRLELERLV